MDASVWAASLHFTRRRTHDHTWRDVDSRKRERRVKGESQRCSLSVTLGFELESTFFHAELTESFCDLFGFMPRGWCISVLSSSRFVYLRTVISAIIGSSAIKLSSLSCTSFSIGISRPPIKRQSRAKDPVCSWVSGYSLFSGFFLLYTTHSRNRMTWNRSVRHVDDDRLLVVWVCKAKRHSVQQILEWPCL